MRPSPIGGWFARRSSIVLLGILVLGAHQHAAWGQEYFARNLGGSYQLVSYGQSYGARLTRYPPANSPAALLGLEPGDMIVGLDNQAIRRPEDLDSHWAQTAVTFVNIRTGQLESRSVFIPNWIAQERLSRTAANLLRRRVIPHGRGMSSSGTENRHKGSLRAFLPGFERRRPA